MAKTPMDTVPGPVGQSVPVSADALKSAHAAISKNLKATAKELERS